MAHCDTAEERAEGVLRAVGATEREPGGEWRAAVLEWLGEYLREVSPGDVRAMVEARSWLRHAWPWNSNLPRPKPKTYGTFHSSKEIAQKVFSVFVAAGAAEEAGVSEMLLRHFGDRYPLIHDDDGWVQRRRSALREKCESSYRSELRAADTRVRELSSLVRGCIENGQSAEHHTEPLRLAWRQRQELLRSMQHSLNCEERTVITSVVEGRARQGAALREWAANRVRSSVREWLYKPDGPLGVGAIMRDERMRGLINS